MFPPPCPPKCHTKPSSSLLRAQLVLSVHIRFRYPSDPPCRVSRPSAALLATVFPPAEPCSLQVSPRHVAHKAWPESPLALNRCWLKSIANCFYIWCRDVWLLPSILQPVDAVNNLLSEHTCFVGNGTWKGVVKYSPDLFLENITAWFGVLFFFFFSFLISC